jgi:hypothetical protein
MLSLLESESTLSSVVGSSTLGQWHSDLYNRWRSQLLAEDAPISQLHKKFWGKSMEEEEQVWRETQPTTAHDRKWAQRQGSGWR